MQARIATQAIIFGIVMFRDNVKTQILHTIQPRIKISRTIRSIFFFLFITFSFFHAMINCKMHHTTFSRKMKVVILFPITEIVYLIKRLLDFSAKPRRLRHATGMSPRAGFQLPPYEKCSPRKSGNCILERKSYIDRISSCGCKCIGKVANGRLRFQIKGYGCKAFFFNY